MKLFKLRFLNAFAVFLFTILPAISYAETTFVIDIDGLNEPISEIQSFSIWLNVDVDFTFSNFASGDAIPDAIMMGWDIQKDIASDADRGRVLKLGGLDRDGAFMDNFNELSNGIICSFDYEGVITGVSDVFQFSDRSGNNRVDDLGLKYVLSSTGLHISAVPIPAAIYLFGAGLIGIVSLRRKTRA